MTNDDGWRADGIANLRAAARRIFADAEICTVAPSDSCSMCGHSLTTYAPLASTETGPRAWKVDGTPADCVRVALSALKLAPDLVVSGVNHGGNLGQDVHVSGTVAAAREAAYHGIPALAISQYLRRRVPLRWVEVQELAVRCLADYDELAGSEGRGVWNYNLPHLNPGSFNALLAIREAYLEPQPLPVSFESEPGNGPGSFVHTYTGVYPARESTTGSDVHVCFGGEISRTWIPV